jgi:preprotein translocase subunit SecA
MFEAMMNRFQEDTVRFLFLMQIVGPDGQPMQALPAARAVPGAPPVDSAGLPAPAARTNGNGRPPSDGKSIPIPVRPPTTTIDQLEADFQRKKKRELEQARMAGGGLQPQVAQRRAGEKVGRNDPCPCGSGKKYKKCHGVEN